MPSVNANSIFVIAPYKLHGAVWVFDDEKFNLNQEPFVGEANAMIDVLVKDIPGAEKGFLLFFSANSFPDFKLSLRWLEEGNGGNWYWCDQLQAAGWLCPVLGYYFPETPKNIYVKAASKPGKPGE